MTKIIYVLCVLALVLQKMAIFLPWTYHKDGTVQIENAPYSETTYLGLWKVCHSLKRDSTTYDVCVDDISTAKGLDVKTVKAARVLMIIGTVSTLLAILLTMFKGFNIVTLAFLTISSLSSIISAILWTRNHFKRKSKPSLGWIFTLMSIILIVSAIAIHIKKLGGFKTAVLQMAYTKEPRFPRDYFV